MACILIVVAPLLPAEKKNKVCFLIGFGSLQFILGMKKGECAGLDIDLNRKAIDLNEEPQSSESTDLKPNNEVGPSAPVESQSSSDKIEQDPAAYEEMEK
jgi:hypothetical protein